MSIKSERLKLFGRADLVEFHKIDKQNYKPFPVEYKRGKPKQGLEDKIQLCAQAFCLEETFDCEIVKGALFYGKEKRRQEVEFNTELRAQTLVLLTSQLFYFLFNREPNPGVRFTNLYFNSATF